MLSQAITRSYLENEARKQAEEKEKKTMCDMKTERLTKEQIDEMEQEATRDVERQEDLCAELESDLKIAQRKCDEEEAALARIRQVAEKTKATRGGSLPTHSEETKAEIRERLRRFQKGTKIAVECNVSQSYVSEIRQEMIRKGVLHPNGMQICTPKTKAEIRERLKRSEKGTKIAAEYGVSGAYVSGIKLEMKAKGEIDEAPETGNKAFTKKIKVRLRRREKGCDIAKRYGLANSFVSQIRQEMVLENELDYRTGERIPKQVDRETAELRAGIKVRLRRFEMGTKIAVECNVSQSYVSRIRQEMEARGEIDPATRPIAGEGDRSVYNANIISDSLLGWKGRLARLKRQKIRSREQPRGLRYDHS